MNIKREIENLEENKMSVKRLVSGLLGFPLVAVILILGNNIVIDVLFSLISMLCIHEYFKSFEGKAKPIQWLGYIASAFIAFIHIIPEQYALSIIEVSIPCIFLILFAQLIGSEMKKNLNDIMITLFGIAYIVVFLLFFPLLSGTPEIGKYFVWYILFVAWGTDIFAFVVGKKWGKHKFTSISPNKTVEGCIAGVIGAVALSLIYTVVLNHYFNMEISYIYIGIISVLLSFIGQIGDLAASAIKRTNGIKDFSNLIPGHGGMLDRFDSVIAIAPFAYFFLTMIVNI